MASRSILGEFERAVMLSVYKLGDNAYGTPILDETEQITGRDVSLGAIYTTLGRLEEKGLLTSSLGESTPQRGGRAKKYFQLTRVGQQSLNDSLSALKNLAFLSTKLGLGRA